MEDKPQQVELSAPNKHLLTLLSTAPPSVLFSAALFLGWLMWQQIQDNRKEIERGSSERSAIVKTLEEIRSDLKVNIRLAIEVEEVKRRVEKLEDK